MWRHRGDLIKLLDRVLGELDQGLEYLQQHSPGIDRRSVNFSKERYNGFKRLLLGQECETLGVLTRKPFRIDQPFQFIYLSGCPQDPTRDLFVRSLSHVRSCAFTTLASRPTDSISIPYGVHSLTSSLHNSSDPIMSPSPPPDRCHSRETHYFGLLDQRRASGGSYRTRVLLFLHRLEIWITSHGRFGALLCIDFPVLYPLF